MSPRRIAVLLVLALASHTACAQSTSPISVDLSGGIAYAYGGGARIGGYAGFTAPRIAVRGRVWQGERMQLSLGIDGEHVIGEPLGVACPAIVGGSCTDQSDPNLDGWIAATELRRSFGGASVGLTGGVGRYTLYHTPRSAPTGSVRAWMAGFHFAVPAIGKHVLFLLGARLLDVPSAAVNPIRMVDLGVRLQ